jgi:hypothetical protein
MDSALRPMRSRDLNPETKMTSANLPNGIAAFVIEDEGFACFTIQPPCGAKKYGDLISMTFLIGKEESWYVDHESAGNFPHRVASETARDMCRALMKRGWTCAKESRCSAIDVDHFRRLSASLEMRHTIWTMRG